MDSTAHTVAHLFNDAKALEKILKLFQAVSQIIAGLQWSQEEAARWSEAGSQIALCRSYLPREHDDRDTDSREESPRRLLDGKV